MNPKVDAYLADGCGRCSLYKTPECKVNRWREEMNYLRMLILDTELSEDSKWGVAVYTLNNKNVLLLSAFKEHCSIGFFKGALLKDQHKLLVQPGENTQSSRMFKFTSLNEIIQLNSIIKEYIHEAIEIEKSGLKIDFNAKHELTLAEEFQNILDRDPELKKAFEALTPGRQRAYNIYFSAPKQAKTRESRIEKYIDKILDGKGLYDD